MLVPLGGLCTFEQCKQHGELLAAPFTARPVPGALCSATLAWEEVEETLELKRFTIKSLPERTASLGQDPLAHVLADKPDLVTAIWRTGVAHGRLMDPPRFAGRGRKED